MLILNKQDITTCYTMLDAIKDSKKALTNYSQGLTTVPLRTAITAKNGQNLFMPAYNQEDQATGIKIVSVFPNNPKIGKPAVPAHMLLLDGQTGEISCLMDGTYLTQLRTGAVQGLATDLLAKKNAKTALLIGTGGQAAAQLEAMLTVRPLTKIYVSSINLTEAQEFAITMAQKFKETTVSIEAVSNPNQVVPSADIITCVTTSKLPVFDGRLIQPGTHINGVGAYTPSMLELPVEAITKATIRTVDTLDGVMSEAGDILEAINQTTLTLKDFSEIGQLDTTTLRQTDQDITLFKTVGSAILDVVTAQTIYTLALSKKIGQKVQL